MGREENQLKLDIEKLFDTLHILNWRNQVFKKRNIKQGIPGLPDQAAILPNGITAYIEAKRPGKKQSSEQIEFEAYCKKRGTPYILAYSVDDVIEYLKEYFKGTRWHYYFDN